MQIWAIKQNETTAIYRRVYFSDTTGTAGAGRVSKNGAASAVSAVNTVEFDSTNMAGKYYYEFSAGEVDTAGYLIFVKGANIYEVAMILPDSPLTAALTASQIAQQVMKEDWTAITGEASRSLINALRMGRNAWDITGGVLTVKKEDGTTTAFTKTVTGTPSVVAMGN